MRARELVLIISAICAGGFLLAALTAPAVGVSQAFNLSRTLPTGSTYFNGNPNCGPNETVHADFPANGMVSFWTTQNETDASVDIWMDTSSGFSAGNTFLSTGQGHTHGTVSSGDFIIVFKACGPTKTVSFGFWGVANYSVPLL
jgi:hypothetical protein